jgi:predicted RecA/RadA family phage recombinase
MKNYRSTGARVVVTASAARTSGQVVNESGWPGVCETDIASGARGALRVSGEFEIPTIASVAKGDDVYISTDGLNTLSRVASGGAHPASTLYLGRVSATPADPNAGSTAANVAPPSGFIWVILGRSAI